MTNPADDSAEPRRQAFGDIRDDYDDEFGRVLGPRDAALRRVRGPAVALQVIGSLAIAGLVVGEVALVYENFDRALAGRTRHVFNLACGSTLILLGLVVFALVIAGGLNMMRLQRRGLALSAAYVVTGLSLAGCYAILFFPFGIWALIVLYQPDVRREFGRPPPPRDGDHD